MKSKKLVIVFFLIQILGLSASAQAALYDRGGGLVYDDGLDLTWLMDANAAAGSAYDNGQSSSNGAMTWYNAVAWANDLTYAGYTDWRLPLASPVRGTDHYYIDPDSTYNGSTDAGYNISAPGSVYEYSTAHELAYLYYNSLGNLGYVDIDGNLQSGSGLLNTGPFENLTAGVFWTGSFFGPNSFGSFAFKMYSGSVITFEQNYELYAWAVREGDVGDQASDDIEPVPLPGALWLFGSGLVGAGWFGRRRRPGHGNG